MQKAPLNFIIAVGEVTAIAAFIFLLTIGSILAIGG